MGYGLGGYGSPVPSDPGMGRDWSDDNNKPVDEPVEKKPEKIPKPVKEKLEEMPNVPTIDSSESSPWWAVLSGVIIILAGVIWLVRWIVLKLFI